MTFGLFVPQRTDARLIVPELDKLLNAPGAPTAGLVRLIAMERLNGILAITQQRQYLDDVRRFVEVLDREGDSNERRLWVYRVQNGRSKDLVKTINAAFGRGSGGGDQQDDPQNPNGPFPGDTQAPPPGGNPLAPPPASAAPGAGGASAAGAQQPTDGRVQATITSDEANNSVVVFGTQRDFAVIEDALRKLDILPQQVMIEAAITEVTLNDNLRYGVQWSFDSGRSNAALSEGTSSTPVRQFPGFSYFYLGNSISATLNALEQRTHINVISAPSCWSSTTRPPRCRSATRCPWRRSPRSGWLPRTRRSSIRSSIAITGVILRITPRVNASGLVLLDVSQEVSAVSAATTTTAATTNSPTISTRRISTSVAVQDGQVIALGGLIRDSRTRGKDGIPYLSRIPVVGGLLFGRTDNSEDRTELLVLLKPHVLRTPEDATAVTDELRSKIQTVEPLYGRTVQPARRTLP